MSARFNPRVSRPPFLTVPLSTGLQWSGIGGSWTFQEKMDGRWDLREIDGSWLAGELMRDGRFYGFDIPIIEGQDISREPLRHRLTVLADFIREHHEVFAVPAGSGGEFLEHILSRGGEGVVAKHLESRYGELGAWIRCKRVETHDCVVTEIHPRKQSIQLGSFGWCSAIRFPGVQVGDVVEIRCHSLHPSGKFREPVLIRLRPDKAVRTAA